ncbi:MAG: MarR family transcriptional regulator, lower aerobic nicotinate degradation pathway regulator [Mycobacteriales bacterium]|jgi:DNA-binding MarR family transcriptional regulator
MASAPAGGPSESLTGRTGYRLMMLGERLKAAAVETLAALGVRPRHFNVLAALASGQAPSQQDLSRMLTIDPNVMVSLIDDLEQLGLAERQANPRDRRRHAIVLTKAGRRVLADGAALIDAAERRIFGHLSADELAVLHDVSGRLLTAPWGPSAEPAGPHEPAGKPGGGQQPARQADGAGRHSSRAGSGPG